MTNEILEQHLRDIGFTVDRVAGSDGQPYLVIRDYLIPAGSLAGRTCQVAIQCAAAVPYVMPPAIHTNPALIPMGTRNTQASPMGIEWQYWSRTLRIASSPSPDAIVAHVATIFSEV